ncbi:MAG: hypothetical protein EXQ67_01950 [Thermoleophilia bacterium]|nr:hypothetical protein [Thermoleophilia bacterium]
MAGAVRINRYLAAAGLGTRREVEGLIRTGRVTINGSRCEDPSTRVQFGDDVLLDNTALAAGPTGVVLHREVGMGLAIVHPGTLYPVLPLDGNASGIELLLSDQRLAQRLADPLFPLAAQVGPRHRRLRLGGIGLDGLEPGDWRPLAPRELQRLRRGARLPPTAG